MKKYFLTGLVTLLPLAVTVWIIHFALDFLTKPFVGIVTEILVRLHISSFAFIGSPQVIRTISQIIVILFLAVLTFSLGFVARRFFFRGILHYGDRILHKIPLVNKVYKTSKEIVFSVFGSGQASFKQVVMLPFPNPDSYCIGLISHDAPHTCSEKEGKEMVSVFIPTTPNPTTGFLVMCHKEELIFLEMKAEEAIKYIVSCGVIQPITREKQQGGGLKG